MSWAQTQKAIQDAIVRASGLSDGKVIWGYQNADSPGVDYVELNLSPLSVVGIDFVVTDYSDSRPEGSEIAQTVTGVREVDLNVTVFTSALVGDSDALALAEKIRTGLVLPSVRALMAAQGVTPFDPGPAQYIPEIVSAGFRGRAVMAIRCYMPAPTVVEYTTYISTVNGTATVKGGVQSPKDYSYSLEVSP